MQRTKRHAAVGRRAPRAVVADLRFAADPQRSADQATSDAEASGAPVLPRMTPAPIPSHRVFASIRRLPVPHIRTALLALGCTLSITGCTSLLDWMATPRLDLRRAPWYAQVVVAPLGPDEQTAAQDAFTTAATDLALQCVPCTQSDFPSYYASQRAPGFRPSLRCAADRSRRPA